jgi:hypothetical protein
MSKSDNGDDTNYFSSLKYGRDEGVALDTHVDISDAYANYKQYMVSFQHLATGKTVHFKAYVTDYNENFNCSWSPTAVYGRTDPIQSYTGTSRKVSLAFDVPAASVGEAYENLGRISKLVQMLYPTYQQNEYGSGYMIGQSPLVRVKMMNLITNERRTANIDSRMTAKQRKAEKAIASGDASPQEILEDYKTNPNPANGVLAAIGSLTYRSDIQKIQLFEKAPNTILPQSLAVNISFDVIHEATVGWLGGGVNEALDPSFPHKVVLSESDDLLKIGDGQNPQDISTRMADERANQAREDQKRASKNRLLEQMAVRGLGRGLSNIGSSAVQDVKIGVDDD